MAVDDYRSAQERQNFEIQQQLNARNRGFGFQTGLGTQAPTGQLPSGPAMGSMGSRQGPNMGGQPNYGIPQGSNYGAGSSSGRSTMPTSSGGGSFSQAWAGAGRRGQQSITAPANSRAMRRGVNQNVSTSERNINITFGNQEVGNVSTGGGDILGTGAQQDKRTQIAFTPITTGNKSLIQDASGGAGGTTGAGGAGGDSIGGDAKATATGGTAPKRARTGGRVAGQLSQNPRAVKRREATAAARAAGGAAAAGGKGGNSGSANGGAGGSPTASQGDTISVNNTFDAPWFASGPQPPSGTTQVGSGNTSVYSPTARVNSPSTTVRAPRSRGNTPPAGGGNPPPPPPPPPAAGGSTTPPNPPPPGGGSAPAAPPRMSGAPATTPASTTPATLPTMPPAQPETTPAKKTPAKKAAAPKKEAKPKEEAKPAEPKGKPVTSTDDAGVKEKKAGEAKAKAKGTDKNVDPAPPKGKKMVNDDSALAQKKGAKKTNAKKDAPPKA